MRSLTLLLTLAGLCCQPVIAQQGIEEYTFQYPAFESAEKEIHTSLIEAIRTSDSSLEHLAHGYVDVGAKQFFATIVQRATARTRDKKALLIVQQDLPEWNRIWTVEFSPIGYPETIEFERSKAFYHNDVLYFMIFRKLYWDMANQAAVDFFSFRPGKSLYLGGIALYSLDNPADPPDNYTFDGELLPFEPAPEGIRITLVRDDLSKYNIDYLLTPDALQLIKDHRPAFHISREEAGQRIAALFEAYYSDEWKEKASTPAGKSERSTTFLWHFYELRDLRSDFAPAHYNIACMLALLDRPDEAIPAFSAAIKLDDRYKTKALTDPDLETLRALPSFKALVE